MATLKDKEGTFNSSVNSTNKSKLKRKIGASPDKSEAQASWADVPVEYVQLLIVNVTTVGGAVTFGRTRDGGALTITPLHDEFERQTHYIRPLSSDGFALMVDIYDTFADMAGKRRWND